MTWTEEAACIGTPTAWWFPEGNQSKTDALALCGSCPVSVKCLRDALNDGGLQFGIRAGYTAEERNRMTSVRLRRVVAGCGTEAGYTAHRRAGVPTCGACQEAHAAYNRLRSVDRDWHSRAKDATA